MASFHIQYTHTEPKTLLRLMQAYYIIDQSSKNLDFLYARDVTLNLIGISIRIKSISLQNIIFYFVF